MSLYSPNEPHFIRGVNIGGWLVLERYITPYTFAVTDCHQQGDFCWYPGQIDAPSDDAPNYKICNIDECNAVLSENVFNTSDYPMDEWNLALAFEENPDIGAQWLNSHFEHFLKREDLMQLKKAGITHVRVPLPHWILGDIDRTNTIMKEPWIAADRWKYFVRMCGWARKIGLEVWPNIHTAPGSQNGFDNSGVQNALKTCAGWSEDPKHVQRSLDILLEVATAIKNEGLLDVVTGFGLLNEPFADCNFENYQKFMDDGITILRRTLGDDISIYMSDLFMATKFNDGRWGLSSEKFNNTFLDSHYYHVFADTDRTMTPYEHIESVCHSNKGYRVEDCCFEDAPYSNELPSHGVQRIVAEWSAAFDAMPGEILKLVMKGIYEYGVAPLMDRKISAERKGFLTKYIQSQIVSYEVADIGVAHGWFFWTLKLEGRAFVEWDFCKLFQSSPQCLGAMQFGRYRALKPAFYSFFGGGGGNRNV
jgi:glucan 1,3-beta-glucosidase